MVWQLANGLIIFDIQIMKRQGNSWKLRSLLLAIDQVGSYPFPLQKPLYAFLPLFEENFNKALDWVRNRLLHCGNTVSKWL